jgi:hypothetical protein
MNIIKMQKDFDSLYDVADVKTGYQYWYFKLINILLDMFTWKNLPEGLSSREIELNLIMTGHAVILPKKDGTLFTPLTSLYGYDEYYQPTHAVFANPVVVQAHQYKIGEECSVIYNNKLKDSLYYIKSDGGLNTFVKRYARLLADIESTIDIYSVNARLTSFPVANDGNVMESLKLFFKKLALGKRAIISDNSIIEEFRNVDINRSNIKDGLNDLLIARDKVLEQYFREIGVKMYNSKKAQVTDDEVDANTQLLLISKDDMQDARDEGADMTNDLFGTDMIPELNPKFDIREVENNDTTQSTEVSGLGNASSNEYTSGN